MVFAAAATINATEDRAGRKKYNVFTNIHDNLQASTVVGGWVCLHMFRTALSSSKNTSNN